MSCSDVITYVSVDYRSIFGMGHNDPTGVSSPSAGNGAALDFEADTGELDILAGNADF
jgi:hypothetical protein